MKTIGLASDHAGFELKQYVKNGWKLKDGNTRILVLTLQKVATIPIMHIHWRWP